MPRYAPIPKPLLAMLATLFAAATIFYSGLWIYCERWQIPVQLGFDNEYVKAEQSQLLTNIYKDSPAEKAGLQAGDRILKVDGERFETDHSLDDIWARHKPGDTVELTIQRPHVPTPFTLRATFRTSTSRSGKLTDRLSRDIIETYPVIFLVVGFTVLFLRLEDPYAWLLALEFTGAISIANWSGDFAGLGAPLRRFAMTYRATFLGLDAALFYLFFAVFPARSPIDRRAPWLKWLGLALGLCFVLPGLGTGSYETPAVVGRLYGQLAARAVRMTYAYGFHTLGMVSLVGNALAGSTSEARRKSRVIVGGTLVGCVPALLGLGAQELLGFQMSLWLTAMLVLLLCVYPLSFAYAVAKHRVLEIPVLLRRSARYLLVQRGFLFLQILISVGAAAAFAWGLPHTHVMTPLGLTGGVVFGSALALGGLRIHQATAQRVDRAFFRNAYDARMILEDLVEKTRTATTRNELEALLERHLRQALQPASFAVYLEMSDGQLSAVGGSVPAELQILAVAQPLLAELARHGRPWEVPDLRDVPQPFVLAPLRPDCLVPILGRDGRLVGLVVLGQRLSEEPYSREDKQLLAAAANQAGMALESIRLGEKIAERIETERRAAQEMEYAKQVQAKLFPQKLPPLRTMEYTGRCIQARQVGGDYYDFLSLGSGHLGIVLADVAGKGISGALLMANLQANLRSQCATALQDLPGLLRSVNQLFFENTDDNSYATLFFGDYDDSTRRLRYVNCGHLPPLLLRTNGGDERLLPTATVLGLFEKWECTLAEAGISPGDILALYTDGVTEAPSAAGEDFGESRLLESLKSHSHLPVGSLLQSVVEAVEQFSGGQQYDDVTLVIARSLG